MTDKTRYEKFVEDCKSQLESNMGTYRDKMSGNGQFQYNDLINDLCKLQNKINYGMMIYLFGDILGEHYWDKYQNVYNRNILNFLVYADGEAKFFILHELKTNKLV